jgi:hypothetical protein
MSRCEQISQSVDVDVPAAVANKTWTQFLFWNIYHRSLRGPDETEAEPEPGLVRMEAVDGKTTRVTVDLNYCAHYKGIDDAAEIAQTQRHLQETLGHYKAFVESQRA